jgi:hypothetical protein
MWTNREREKNAIYSSAAILLLIGQLGAAGCAVDDSQAKLQSCAAEKENLQQQISALQGELETLRQRKDVIYTMRMVVDFSGVQGPAVQAGAPATTFLTEGRLISRDGTVFRFLGRSSPASSTQDVPELIFQPIDPSQWTARRIGTLNQLETLTLDFPASFNAAGITWGEAPRFRAQFEVNGIPVANLADGIDPAAAKAGQPLTWSVRQAFEKVSEEYTRQLNRRAG